jgi:uroporphyrinogen-III synthase
VTVPPLAGFTVAVTADRRRHELATLFERHGAKVLLAPAIRIAPLADDEALLAATRDVLACPPDILVVTTGIGFRGWTETADGWGLGERLLASLGSAEIVARGPKARGAIRAAGLADGWHPASECSGEMLTHLLASGVAGKRIAIQLHGEPILGFTESLRGAGADVVEVPVYRWAPHEDAAPQRRLVELVAAAQVDAVAFTSAPAASCLLGLARELGCEDDFTGALRGRVMAACVGPVTAAPFTRLGIPTVQPERARLGALVRAVTAELPARSVRLRLDRNDVELRGQALVVNGVVYPLPPASLALLRALAARPGRVYSRAELLTALPASDAGEHAVEMAVTRLRAAVGGARLVETVVKRGYRLLADDPVGRACADVAEEQASRARATAGGA